MVYFACCQKEDKDGEVIIFKHRYEDVTNYPIINAIADTYRFTRGSETSLDLFFGDIKNQSYFLEQKQTHEICHIDNEKGGKWVADCCKELFYIYAPIRSMRQQVQHGRYILFPNHIDYKINENGYFEWKIDAIPKDHKDIVKRIIIPGRIKKQLMLDLSVLGISEEFLFCDNVDTVCKGIVNLFKRKYS